MADVTRDAPDAVVDLKTFTEIPLKDGKENPIGPDEFPETIGQVLARQPGNDASYAANAWGRQGGVGGVEPKERGTMTSSVSGVVAKAT